MEIPTILGEPADKWYSRFLRDIKHKYGENWSQAITLTPEEETAWLKLHQLATRALIIKRRDKQK